MLQSNQIRFPAVLLLLLALAACTSGPEATIEKFHRAVSEGEITDALALLADECFENLGREKWEGVIKVQSLEVNQKGGIRSIETKGEATGGDRVPLLVTVTYGNGETTSEWINLVKQTDGWRIDCRK